MKIYCIRKLRLQNKPFNQYLEYEATGINPVKSSLMRDVNIIILSPTV